MKIIRIDNQYVAQKYYTGKIIDGVYELIVELTESESKALFFEDNHIAQIESALKSIQRIYPQAEIVGKQEQLTLF